MIEECISAWHPWWLPGETRGKQLPTDVSQSYVRFVFLLLFLLQPLLSSRHLFLSLVTPPTITTEPTSDLLVFVGVAVSLPCTASGFPPPAFTWARGDGTPVDLQNSEDSSNCGTFHGVFILFFQASFSLSVPHTIFL